MSDRKIAVQFTALTFCIAILISETLIVLGQFGYTVYSFVNSLGQFAMNIPFSLYILSPAIASYIVLRKNNSVKSIWEWLRNVFYIKNRISIYILVAAGLLLYFSLHFFISGGTDLALPFYMFFLSLPGNIIIGGLEESGWVYILQPALDKKYGYIVSALFTGFIWLLWHIPLFFIPGTAHREGLIDFGMFAVQIFAFRFFYGAVARMSGKGGVFMCMLFHTMFNAATPVVGILPMTWVGTIAANCAIVILSLAAVVICNKKAGIPINK
ncbi:MAG: CPBP family intramembrane glutamic endopeptidase [Eubacteriales bacterium]